MNVFIDAAYATHPDMNRHTRRFILFCRGVIMSKSTKQQLNTTSSTEAEFVGCSNFITSAIYTGLFLSTQGYEMKRTTLHQDNQSVIKLLVNGRGSCGKRSRHIDIRYFFVKDRIKKGEFKVEYCPTESMIVDFFQNHCKSHYLKKLAM